MTYVVGRSQVDVHRHGNSHVFPAVDDCVHRMGKTPDTELHPAPTANT